MEQDTRIEWIKPLDPAEFLGSRTGLYREPKLTLSDGTVIDRSKPGPFA